ncbi:response regulator [Dyadobacter jiangsuensis]|uniref:Response regulator receiver domain-containing protein n=1 Tax=Dyadobacter jiangsuensis TaxID=1591085 RepID=A0A2P8G906_9BACT|nr:response regulator [Dyadobacter jiangsuensis]PSL30355.1 response regulator receiver domain-containing protein [Dyadobacter jiangsuensis]
MLYQNILLIDDDEDDQEIFLTALESTRKPVRCTVLDSARKALRQIIQGEIEADLIFLDLNMPLMNGQQFLTEIKKDEQLRKIPIVILSTSSNAATAMQVKQLGACHFFTKPDRFEDLVAILNEVLV